MSEKISLHYRFLEPLAMVLKSASSNRDCPKYTDGDFLKAGLARCLNPVVSGREFLQLGFETAEKSWKRSSYFEALKSPRRCEYVCEVAKLLTMLVRQIHGTDQWPEDIPELDGFEVFAGDGHFHNSATHDPKAYDGRTIPVGQFFARDMRRGTLHYLDTAVPAAGGSREHDMGMLKRLSSEALRLGTEKGRKVLYVWDRAGIEFKQWYNWKHSSAIYFLTRAKENMSNDTVGEHVWNTADPRNNGVVSDTLTATSVGVAVRRIGYMDPASGKEFVFVTNLPKSVPPGIVAWLYQRRWDIEKTFDETRNRLWQGKAWASSVNAKRIQGAFISIAYNLLIILEERLRQSGDLPAEPKEEQRREQRQQTEIQKAQAAGREINYQLQRRPWRSQIGCKFIRWVRRHLSAGTSYGQAVHNLGLLYEEFS